MELGVAGSTPVPLNIKTQRRPAATGQSGLNPSSSEKVEFLRLARLQRFDEESHGGVEPFTAREADGRRDIE